MKINNTTTENIVLLTDAELLEIRGGSWLGDAFRVIGQAIAFACYWVDYQLRDYRDDSSFNDSAPYRNVAQQLYLTGSI